MTEPLNLTENGHIDNQETVTVPCWRLVESVASGGFCIYSGLSQLGSWSSWCLVDRGQGVPRMHRTAPINESSGPKGHRAEDEKVTGPKMRDWGRCWYCFKPCPPNQLESPSPPQSGSCQVLYLCCLPSCPHPPGSATIVFLLVL